jgi:hypothetical protein
MLCPWYLGSLSCFPLSKCLEWQRTGHHSLVSRPQAPNHTVIIGYVVYSHSNQGKIFVKVDNGYEIGELHDVVDTSTNTTHGELLVKSGSVWKNGRQLTGSYGLTGSLSVTSGGITSSLFGTASWATNALTASNLTPAITNNTDNRVLTATGNGSINGEANLTFDGSLLDINGLNIILGRVLI